MGLPANVVSAVPITAPYYPPDDQVTLQLVDYEDGGIAVQDASQGLRGYTWSCFIQSSFVCIQRVGADVIQEFTQSNIIELSFAFDQNMRPNFAYATVGGAIWIRYWNSQTNAYVTQQVATGRNPRMTLDDKRDTSTLTSDVLLAYIREDNVLCVRQQRDRFAIEYVLQSGILPTTRLKNIGMNKAYRVQFEMA